MEDTDKDAENVLLENNEEISFSKTKYDVLYEIIYPYQLQNTETRSTYTNFLLSIFTGASSGCSIAYLSFPLEGLKKWLQADFHKRALKSGKVEDQLHLYRGSFIFALNIVPTVTLQYSFRHISRSWIDNGNVLQSFIASFACGVAGAPTATMVERAVVYQQKLRTNKVLPAFKAIYYEGGIKGFFRSFSMIAARDGGFTTWMFMVNPIVDRWTKDNCPPGFSLPIQLLANLCGATITHPFDTVATVMQSSEVKLSAKQAALNLWNSTNQKNGLKKFWSAYSKGLFCRWTLFPFYAIIIPEFDNFFRRNIDSEKYQNGTLARKYGLFKLELTKSETIASSKVGDKEQSIRTIDETVDFFMQKNR